MDESCLQEDHREERRDAEALRSGFEDDGLVASDEPDRAVVRPEQERPHAAEAEQRVVSAEHLLRGDGGADGAGGLGGADVEAARTRYEKTQFLYDVGAVSAHERDMAEAAYQEALSGGVSYQTVTRAASPEAINRAEVQVRQAEAALASAQQASGATELFAPVDGVMYLTDVREGSEVHAGEPVFRIGATDDMWIEAYAAKEYADLIYVGQTVRYSLDGHDFLASVVDIQDLSEIEQKDAAKGTEGMGPNNPHVGQLRIRISTERILREHYRL